MHRRLPSLLCALLFVAVLPACGSSDETASCAPDTGQSIAREWNEAALDAVRSDYPSPTVHARNLFHLSAVMWDTWTAFEAGGQGVFFTERIEADPDGLDGLRHATLSYAAYTFLSRRYAGSPGALESLAQFDEVMARHCYDIDAPVDEPDAPAAIGRRIAGAAIDASIADGSLEPLGYKGTYDVVNEPLLFEEPGTAVVDVNRWQPLEFTSAAPQFDLDIDGGVQTYTTPQWGTVTPFALAAPADGGLPLDPGPPPLLGTGDPTLDELFRDGVIEVVRASSELGDWERSIAEFWADGPNSETPPGHWNTLANEVGDGLTELRFGGSGPELDRLAWDIQTYLVLNGALHDAAIASWGVKEFYDYGRPISMIRHMGGQGQSSDPTAPSFDEAGLPLIDGLVERITAESAASGERHQHLADHVDQIAVMSWIGPTVIDRPDAAQLAATNGIGWIRAVEWLPYQQADFVTPAFPGYVSGHSTFSAAAAEILTLVTGTDRFPSGTGEWTVPAGSLKFDEGPRVDVTLRWDTFHDAADEAGLSRIYGGIHVPADDQPGRVMGAELARGAWQLANEYFDAN